MIISIRLPGQVAAPTHSLPPVLASIGFNEVVILELQGSIETEGNYSGETVALLDMSIPVSQSFHFPIRTRVVTGIDAFFWTKPTLRIGHHLLEGKIASLSKALAVLRTEINLEKDATSPIAFDVVAIIRKKLVFSKRPSPIVTHVSDAVVKEPAKRLKAS